MQFAAGQTIIHPHHGPVKVERTTQRPFHGSLVTYLELTALEQELAIALPVERAADVGLREVACRTQATHWLARLESPPQPEEMNWAHRIKDYEQRLSSGCVEDLCFLVRQITASGEKSPASVEGQILRRALRRLGGELALALGISQDQALLRIQQAVHRRDTA